MRAAYIVLELTEDPMRARDIVDYAIGRGLLSDKLAGKTPHQTMKSKLSVHIRRHGASSPFVRTSPGLFTLRHLEPDQLFEAPPLSPPRVAEQVLVISTAALERLGRFQGIRRPSERLLREVFEPANLSWIDREDAELRDDVKQIVTYTLVGRGEDLLAFKRGTYNRVEDFLRGAHCVGFGGHVNEGDRDLFGLSDAGVSGNIRRELSEELKLPAVDAARLDASEGLTLLGLLNDDSSANGRRHLAVVARYDVLDSPAWDSPGRGERSITQLRWVNPKADRLNLWQFEYWSQLCLREYGLDPDGPAPRYRLVRRQPLKSPILCIVGRVGSGKSEVANWLGERLHYEIINTGRVLAGLLGLPAVPETPRDVFQDAAWAFISEPDGPTRLAAAVLRAARETSASGVIIDGVRQLTTLAELRRLAGRLGVIYVETPPDIAFRFYRARPGGAVSIHDFLVVRDALVEADLGPMIREADAIVYNSFGVQRLQGAIRRLVAEIR